MATQYTSKHGIVSRPPYELYLSFSDMRNFLQMLPEDKKQGVTADFDSIDATVQGFHIGVGKEIALSDGNSVDVYGKYFFNHKNGVSFNAGGHYDLDAVTSSVIRLGARYTVKRDKWNFYGGVAYEHELDGKATGTADGVAIRAAETSGGSMRAELGATMKPGDNSPWSLDLNVAGFAGKKQGFTGGVSVAFMF